jgi:hypothetical protein
MQRSPAPPPDETARSGSLAFPARSWRWPVTGSTWSSVGRSRATGCPVRRTLTPWRPLRSLPLRLAELNQPPLLGFVDTTLHRHPPARRPHSPMSPSVWASRSHRETGAALVVLHHLDGSRRTRVASILQLAANPGVRRVSCWRSANLPKQTRRTAAFPATRFVPSEESHSSAAVPRHRGPCLPAVRHATRPPPKRRPNGPCPTGWAPIHRGGSPHIRRPSRSTGRSSRTGAA